jgi:AcrR family transcriptional regulator
MAPLSPSEIRPALTKHQQRTEATRRALLRSARRIFARDGFEASRIEDIAAAIGHTRGAFYAHFKTKEDLFFVLLEEEGKRRLGEVRSVVGRCRTTQERVAALRDFYINRNVDRQWAMLILEFKLFALRHSELRSHLASTYRRIRASLNFEGLVGTHDNPSRVALEVFLAALTLEHAYDPRRLSRQQMTELLRTVFDALKHANWSI